MATVYKAEQRPTIQVVVRLRKADYHETALQMTLIRLEQGSPEQAVLAAEKRHQELTESNRRYQGLSP
ncbi:hypothetical protein [Thermosporothrix hazakensis]|jgi:hypothetical protein|uniref:Uncharacterized protein n=1 Tax=Thermosporothrix sp. COM3 TaxID=2490863 RepID=A0A455SUB4_9CHLR|nr:hypothetical protein [Thermosporothrix hazakensis]BBH88734.1 hypothetical protein KTC_34850 [Thermosporothrix sp. COM3]GCE46918.1 hypothetical protein KTH_17870 [Thermosporothrix hazakensis]